MNYTFALRKTVRKITRKSTKLLFCAVTPGIFCYAIPEIEAMAARSLRQVRKLTFDRGIGSIRGHFRIPP